MKKSLVLIIAVFVSASCFSQVNVSQIDSGIRYVDADAGKGWGAGSAQNERYYDIHTPGEFLPGDTSIGYIKSKSNSDRKSGAVYHSISLEQYSGKRVRMTVWGQTINVTDPAGAGFWFFASAYTESVLDNAKIEGTSDWTKYSMVIDVFPSAYLFTCGVFLNGNGEIIFKDINFEVVDASIPVTATARKNLER